VTTALTVRVPDDASATRELMRGIRAELRRIRRADERVLSHRVRSTVRPGRYVEVRLTIDAPTEWQALQVGSSVMRSAIHAAGSATVGWEHETARVVRFARTPSTTSRPLPRPDRSDVTWAALSAAERHRAALVPPMPAYVRPPLAGRLIDLRG
jgi:hypothetical protein